MSQFISFTEETGPSRDILFVNLDQIAFARYDGADGMLLLALVSGHEFHVSKEEAAAILPALRARRKTGP